MGYMLFTKFIILTTQRTGSTYLRIWLNKHPEIRSHGEVFLNTYPAPDGFNSFLRRRSVFNWFLFKNRFLTKLNNVFNSTFLSLFLGKDILNYLHRFFYASDFPLAFNRFDNKEIFDNIKTAKTKDAKAIGFKLMYGQLKINKTLQNWIENEKPKIIYLERNDKLAICYSKYIKNKLKLAHSEKSIQHNKFKGNKKFFRHCINKQISQEKAILQFLKDKDYLKISYENFFNKEDTKKKVLRYLDVSENFEPEVSLNKINKQHPSEVLSNYEDISKLIQTILDKA